MGKQSLEVAMKTQGEIEAAICAAIAQFEQQFMGRGPKRIRAALLEDLLVIRLQGVLTAAEQQLVKAEPSQKGRDLLKQVRYELVEIAQPTVAALVEQITGTKVVSMHHDLSTVTGEEVVLFTLVQAPEVRNGRQPQDSRTPAGEVLLVSVSRPVRTPSRSPRETCRRGGRPAPRSPL
jgi:uncharacterized protein YbcI